MTIEQIYKDERFEKYYSMILEWNEKINLTAILEREEAFLKHFFDSVLPLDLLPGKGRLLDVGSGAGLPAVPLKLLRPSLDVTMTDSVGKKVAFLKEVIKCLDLKGICAEHVRIEDFKAKDFDVVTARAVAPLRVLLEYCLPFVRAGGLMLAYKGSDVDAEILDSAAALKILGGEVERIERRPLADEIMRSFVVVRKTKPSPAGYPRGGNKPRLKPL